MALKSGAAFTVWGMKVLPQIVSVGLCVSCDMVWLEKSSSFHPSSCPLVNLRSKIVWMMGSCHRKKCNFWQDLNSYSFYKSCWNEILVHFDDIVKGLFLILFCSYKSVKLKVRHVLCLRISESHSSFYSPRTGSSLYLVTHSDWLSRGKILRKPT